MRRGKFITLEGPEGCGKSTQAARLQAWLEASGEAVVMAREPGGTPTGEAIRDILQHNASGEAIAVPTEVLLFAASRAQLVAHRIAPALQRGAWVICDRYVDSTLAYQGYGRGLPVDELIAINRYAVNGVWPDLTLFFDLPLPKALARIADRAGHPDRFEREEVAFHERVLEGYHRLAERFPERFVTLRGEGTVDEVFAGVLEAIKPLRSRVSP